MDRMALIARLGAAIATTDGDLKSVLTDALEAVVEDHATIVATQSRRARDRARKQGKHSAESAESSEIRGGSSPLPSSSFPTPHITPSFPPSPLPPRQPQGVIEQQVADRAPEAWPVILRFVAGKDDTATTAWMGRMLGALDRAPNPTGLELRDALEDLMTEPREKWVPPLFRRYVERIRRDADKAAGRELSAVTDGKVQGTAATLWTRYRQHGLLSNPDRPELERIGALLVSAGEYGSVRDFLDELRLTKPWELNNARTDGYAINELARRLSVPQKVPA